MMSRPTISVSFFSPLDWALHYTSDFEREVIRKLGAWARGHIDRQLPHYAACDFTVLVWYDIVFWWFWSSRVPRGHTLWVLLQPPDRVSREALLADPAQFRYLLGLSLTSGAHQRSAKALTALHQALLTALHRDVVGPVLLAGIVQLAHAVAEQIAAFASQPEKSR